MAQKTAGPDAELAQSVTDPEYVFEYVAAALEEGETLPGALRRVAQAYGWDALAADAGMATPNLVRALEVDANPTLRTMTRVLAPLGLRIAVTLDVPKRRRRRR